MANKAKAPARECTIPARVLKKMVRTGDKSEFRAALLKAGMVLQDNPTDVFLAPRVEKVHNADGSITFRQVTAGKSPAITARSPRRTSRRR